MAKFSNTLASTGQFCTITFMKNDGSIRVLNGRANVKKYLKGGNERSDSTKEKYLLIWTRSGSRRFDAARNIARDRILTIRAHGVEMKMNYSSNYSQTV